MIRNPAEIEAAAERAKTQAERARNTITLGDANPQTAEAIKFVEGVEMALRWALGRTPKPIPDNIVDDINTAEHTAGQGIERLPVNEDSAAAAGPHHADRHDRTPEAFDEVGSEELSSGEQDQQRPDGCRRCKYSPGPDQGVRTWTSPVCPVHSDIPEDLVCYTIRIETMQNGRWRTVVEHDEYISAGSPEDAASDIIGTTPEIAPVASPLWRARVWLGHHADANAEPCYLIDSVSVEHRLRMALDEDMELAYATRKIAMDIVDSAIHESLREHPGDSRAAEANLAIFAIDSEWHAALGLVIDRLVERGVLHLDEVDFDMTGALEAAGADFITGRAGDAETWKVWLPDGGHIEILAEREEDGEMYWEGVRYNPAGAAEVLTGRGDPVVLVKHVKEALQ